MRSRIWAVCAGLLVALSLPPFGWWPLAFVGVALLIATAPVTAAQNFRRSLPFGLAWLGPGLFWITEFSTPGWILVVVLESVIVAGCIAACVAAMRDRSASSTSQPTGHRNPQGWPVAVGLLVGEIVRSRLPFVGLPLAGLDLGQARGPFAGLAGIGGRALLVSLVVAGGTALAVRGRIRVVLSAVVAGSLLMARIGPVGTHRTGDTIRVALVQGGGPRGLLASPEQALQTYAAQLRATDHIGPAVDLIVWPEDSVDLVRMADRANEVDATLADIARAHHATFVVGVVDAHGTRRFRNYMLVYGPDGEHIDRYDKVLRVPFGEFFPFRPLLKSLGARLPRRDAVAGSGPGIVHTSAGPMAVAISYEGFFASRVRGGVRAGGEVVVIPTNASSYRSTQVPTQQVAAARLRARESGRWVVQVGPTGYSAVIDPLGRVSWRSRLGAAAVHVATVERRRGLTPGQHLDTDLLLLNGVSLWAVIRLIRRRRALRPTERT